MNRTSARTALLASRTSAPGIRALFVALVCVLAASCGWGSEVPDPAPPGDIVLRVNATQRTAIVGQPLEVNALAQRRSGEPLTDWTVEFATTNGAFEIPAVVVDGAGGASTNWVVGPSAGRRQAEARLRDPTGVVVARQTVSVDAVEWRITGEGQFGKVGEQLAQPLQVTIIGPNLRPMRGVAIDFFALWADALSQTSVVTDASGTAATTWTLAADPGEHLVYASTSYGSVPIRAYNEPATPAQSIELSSPTERVLKLGSGYTFQLTARDAMGVPVDGQTIKVAGLDSSAVTGSGSGSGVYIPITGSIAAERKIRFTAIRSSLPPLVLEVPFEAYPYRSEFVKAGGDGQIQSPGSTLPELVRVRLTSADTRAPIALADVTFVTERGGSVSPSNKVRTDANGYATVRWQLGPDEGSQVLRASLTRLSYDESKEQVELQFLANALAQPPVDSPSNPVMNVSIVDGDGQTGSAGVELADALVVRLTGADGEPSVGQRVEFIGTGGGSALSFGVSDANGLARQRWTPGGVLGAQSISARAVAPDGTVLASAEFSVTVGPGEAAHVELSGPSTGSSGQPLPAPHRAVVKDRFFNLVPGAVVSFAASDGGHADPATATTDLTGSATTTWTLGPAAKPVQRLVASSASGVAQVSGFVRDPAPADAQVRVVSGADQYLREHYEISSPVVIEVTDGAGVPLPGVIVSIRAVEGTGYVAPSELVTGENGTTSWSAIVHSVTQQIEVRSGNGVATFGFRGVPSGHPFDGVYACGAWTFEVRSGLVQYQRYMEGGIPGSFSEDTRVLDFTLKVTRLGDFSVQGLIEFEPSGRARAVGTSVYQFRNDAGPWPAPDVNPNAVCPRM